MKEHDNDEGFEETQSLMSESPSQGASSGGNYEPDDPTLLDFPKTKPIIRVSSLQIQPLLTTITNDNKPNNKKLNIPQSNKKVTPTIKSLNKPSTTLDRTNMTRRTLIHEPIKSKSVIPRR